MPGPELRAVNGVTGGIAPSAANGPCVRRGWTAIPNRPVSGTTRALSTPNEASVPAAGSGQPMDMETGRIVAPTAAAARAALKVLGVASAPIAAIGPRQETAPNGWPAAPAAARNGPNATIGQIATPVRYGTGRQRPGPLFAGMDDPREAWRRPRVCGPAPLRAAQASRCASPRRWRAQGCVRDAMPNAGSSRGGLP